MQPSVMGFVVCVALFCGAKLFRNSILVALMASLAFGSTAIASLPSLGGSSPLIYTVFCGLLVLSVVWHRTALQDLGRAFTNYPAFWLVTLLMVYAVISCVFFPRIFAGQTSVFVPTKLGVSELALAPVSGNISQTGYFVLGGITFMAVSLLLMRGVSIDDVRKGFFAWVFCHTAMGVLDLAGKMAGLGDILEPIRTASYAMLTEAQMSGFWRIAGAQAEASGFAGVSLACLPFCYVYWRRTGSRLALRLGLVLLILVIFSTSSTGYVGLAILSIPVMLSLLRSIGRQWLSSADVLILALFAMGFFAVLLILVTYPRFFDPFLALFDTSVTNKMQSSSGQERMYWNIKSLQSMIDTRGLGVGFGSSRASSWPIAVVSQLGIAGSMLMALAVFMLTRETRAFRLNADPETQAVVAATRAAVLGGLVASSMVSGTPDPGILFFVSLAVSTCVQARYADQRGVMTAGIRHYPA